MLLGTDFPGLRELGRQRVNAQSLQLVQTRSQTVRYEGDLHQENMETDCGMGLLSSGMLSLTQLRVVSPSWQKVQ